LVCASRSARRVDILKQFLTEAVGDHRWRDWCFSAWIVGKIMTSIFMQTYPVGAVVGAIGVAAGVMSGLFPAWKAARLIQTLRAD
jgi:hypothetical protein